MSNKIFNNFINLGSIQIITMLVQIILYPFLIKNIGSNEYGKIILAQLIVGYFQVFVVFGTDLTAIKLVSKIVDVRILSEKFSLVFWGRLILSVISLNVYFVGLFFTNVDYIFSLFGLLILEPVFTTRWYYHGRQSLKYFTIPFLLSRIITSLVIFITVNGYDDRNLVIIITVFGYLVGVIIPFLLVIKSGVRLKYIEFKKIYYFFYDSFRLFVTNFMSIAKDRTSSLIIGIFISHDLLVYYEFCIKVANVISSILSSLSSSFYPRFCEKFDLNLYYRVSIVIGTISILPFFILMVFPDAIIYIINAIVKVNIFSMKGIFYFFGILIFVRGHSYYLGLCGLMANNKKKEYTNTLLYSSFLYMILMSMLSVFGNVTLNNICGIYSIVLVFEYLHRFYSCNKFLRG